MCFFSLQSKHLLPPVRDSVRRILSVESSRVAASGQRVPSVPTLPVLALLAEEGRPALALPDQRRPRRLRHLRLLHRPRSVQRGLQQCLLVRQPD